MRKFSYYMEAVEKIGPKPVTPIIPAKKIKCKKCGHINKDENCDCVDCKCGK